MIFVCCINGFACFRRRARRALQVVQGGVGSLRGGSEDPREEAEEEQEGAGGALVSRPEERH